jgi:hypothetical protein
MLQKNALDNTRCALTMIRPAHISSTRLAATLAIVCVLAAMPAHALAIASGREAEMWGPALVGFVAGLAFSETVRFLFRWLAYGWFTLWFTSAQFLKWGAVAGIVLAAFYFK